MKPQSSYQQSFQHENGTKTLVVHVSDDPTSDIYFVGDPSDYDGTAVEPAAPTSEYIDKHKPE